ncbi:MAG TPA: UDP-N-acetylmuramate dehydrogenase [Clostridiaceae bacterium]|jgi:UDP-N-acetylmuramate dehydrogenase|nr:UDP-N-acetylmuramate dehydrogenase [Clostridiaceae bacterium]HBG38200.1 UDP-N-acetylmuramate dehydrogenase [Clostridiaceae bacterium]HBN28711.1 UDP-N-acetylmuramate dehydrogenase [Clostridiaceae bacterium]HCL51009.1 UDP-N-acetylmuramate dehydrogenase [Clostridiaceae bacterium]
MNYNNLKEELESILDINQIRYNELMKNHTSFKVGGAADIFITPNSYNKFIKCLNACKKYNAPYFIMGNGTNLMVRDGGYKGVIIKLTSLNDIKVEGNRITADAGALLSKTANEALKNSLKGLEFASGIPGTVGGALTMNAGAYGPEMKDVVDCAEVVDENGNRFILNRDQLELSYRMSAVQKYNYAILWASFVLEHGEYNQIKDRMDELNKRRVDKQPLEYPSAGSTFKRPDGYFAAKLIDDAGLKGLSVGGAMVSKKHSGFIINYNNATAKDILELIKKVQELVKEKFGVELEPEIKLIGED